MWCNQIFSLIVKNEDDVNEIKNIIVCDNYEIANQLARASYGEEAYAVDTTQYPLGIGYKHIDNRFYNFEGEEILPNPTEAQEIEKLRVEKEQLENLIIESALESDYRLSLLELDI